MKQNNNETKYLDKFYNPDITPYDFLSLFSSVLASQNEYSFVRDSLIEFINHCKKNSLYNNLLKDINLKTNGVTFYSEEFDEAISKLKWARILYTVSPEQDSTIWIFNNIPIPELIKHKESFLGEVKQFINEYKQFSNKNTDKKLVLTDKKTTFN